MLSPWLLSAVIAATLLMLCGLGYLARAAVRTRNRGKCWHCGVSKVRRSQTRPSDKLAGAFLLVPYRCTACLKRFYGFPISPTPSADVQPELQPGRSFRIRVRVRVKLPTWEELPEWLVETVD